MSTILQQMMERAGRDRDEVRPWSKLGRIFRRQGVRDTTELTRVLEVPRREWRGQQQDMAEMLTDWLKRPGGAQVLRPIQAAALTEMHDFEGLFAPVRVGGGKTLISFLAARVMAAERPVLLIPAKLRHKTKVEARAASVHWLFPMPTIISYELLGRAQAAGRLAALQPDLIIADECHKLKSTQAAVTRRVARWMKAYPDTMFVCMSGTITKRSLWDYAHLLEWALPDALFPLPRSFPEMTEWADCLDVKKGEDAQRYAPGALERLFNEDEHKLAKRDSLSAVRIAWRRRLTDTPAVIATRDRALGASLYVTSTRLILPASVEDAFRDLRSLWETPDGWPCAEAVEIWRHCRELACGFFYRWDPRPPPDWLEARKAFYVDVRHILKSNQRQLDSMLPVVRAMDAGHYDDSSLLAWRAIRDSFTPNTVPVWITDHVLDATQDWLDREPGIAWTEHVAFASALAARGIMVYGRGGVNQYGHPIEEADPATGIVCSIAANSEGRNLQGWCRNLVVSAPGNGGMWEQLLGRTHREGQEADEVTVDVMFNCLEQWTAYEQARADARWIEDSTGQEQKLLYADTETSTPTEIAALQGPLWNK